MAEVRGELRDVNLRQLLPWTEIFRGFQVALDPKKLLLAAAGIVVMAGCWWLLAIIFINSRDKPAWPTNYPEADYHPSDEADPKAAQERGTKLAWKAFKEDRDKWNLLYAAAGPEAEFEDAGDLADSPETYDSIKGIPPGGTMVGGDKTYVSRPKPYGEMRTWPWAEDRGPNPYLLVTGQVPSQSLHQDAWSASRYLPVLIEPLRKFLSPILFLLHPKAGFWNSLYFSLVLVLTLATWALFGGAITRMAVVQVARKEKIGMGEAIRFTLARYLSFFTAPLFPMVFVLVIVIFCILFGFLHMIPWFGDIFIDGLGWPLILLAGIIMAVILVGLVGWPLMYATISAEGSDSFDALSRSYSYVYQCPWHYLWYSLVAIVYGALVVFFVGFMGCLMVYLGKWGVSQTPWVERANRDPSFLFIYTPTSYHWRDLLLQGANTPDGKPVVPDGRIDDVAYQQYLVSLHGWNKVGAGMVSIWLYLVFLMIIGFGYSYFWSASSIIYLLMRRKVDDTEMDEVYLEEDEGEDAYTTPIPTTGPVAAPVAAPLQMVDSPSLKPSAPAPLATPASKIESTTPTDEDGNPPV